MTAFTQIIKKYGDIATVHSPDGDKTLKVFLQPILTDRAVKSWKTVTPLGQVDSARFRCFFPPDVVLDKYEQLWVECMGRKLDFVRAEPYRIGGRTSHWEAVLRVREEDGE